MKTRKLQALLLAGLLCLSSALPVLAADFSDGSPAETEITQEEQGALGDMQEEGIFTAPDTEETSLFEAETAQKTQAGDQGISIETADSCPVEYGMGCDRYNFFGALGFTNTGTKPVTLNAFGSKYIQDMKGFTLAPGEYDYYELDPVEENIVMGEHKDDVIIIEDTTGTIHLELPVTLTVTGDGFFTADKTELDFGSYQKDGVLPYPQRVTLSVTEGYMYSDHDWELLWQKGDTKGNLKGNVDAVFNPETKELTVSPKESTEPGVYEGYLSVRNESFDSYGHQIDVKVKMTVLPGEEKKDYAVRVTNDVMNLKYDMGDEDAGEFYGGLSVTNIGRKPIELVISNTKYADIYLESDDEIAQPGETVYYSCAPIWDNLIVGEFTDDKVIIKDTTGNLSEELPVHLTVTSSQSFTVDKKELDFGTYYKGEALPEAQTITLSVLDQNIFNANQVSILYQAGNLKGNITAVYDKTLGTVKAAPSKTAGPGTYEGYLSIRCGYLGEEGTTQQDIKVRMTVLSPKPQIKKATVNKNMITVDISNFQGDSYECVLGTGTQSGAPVLGSGKIASGQTGSRIVFRNVPKGTYYLGVRSTKNIGGEDTTSKWSDIKRVKVSVSTPARPKITSTKVSGKNLTVKVSMPKGAAGYNLTVSKATVKNDNSTTAISSPSKAVYTKKDQKKSNITLTNLKKGTYYVWVQTYHYQNGGKVYSQWSPLKKIKVS